MKNKKITSVHLGLISSIIILVSLVIIIILLKS